MILDWAPRLSLLSLGFKPYISREGEGRVLRLDYASPRRSAFPTMENKCNIRTLWLQLQFYWSASKKCDLVCLDKAPVLVLTSWVSIGSSYTSSLLVGHLSKANCGILWRELTVVLIDIFFLKLTVHIIPTLQKSTLSVLHPCHWLACEQALLTVLGEVAHRLVTHRRYVFYTRSRSVFQRGTETQH